MVYCALMPARAEQRTLQSSIYFIQLKTPHVCAAWLLKIEKDDYKLMQS